MGLPWLHCRRSPRGELWARCWTCAHPPLAARRDRPSLPERVEPGLQEAAPRKERRTRLETALQSSASPPQAPSSKAAPAPKEEGEAKTHLKPPRLQKEQATETFNQHVHPAKRKRKSKKAGEPAEFGPGGGRRARAGPAPPRPPRTAPLRGLRQPQLGRRGAGRLARRGPAVGQTPDSRCKQGTEVLEEALESVSSHAAACLCLRISFASWIGSGLQDRSHGATQRTSHHGESSLNLPPTRSEAPAFSCLQQAQQGRGTAGAERAAARLLLPDPASTPGTILPSPQVRGVSARFPRGHSPRGGRAGLPP